VSSSPKRNNRRNVERRQRRIKRRLARKHFADQPKPQLCGSNIHYEVGNKYQGINCGGIGAVHQLVRRVGLDKEIDENLKLLKFHVPYHESDHVLNIAYNSLVGGLRLEDIELRRNDEAYMDALGAERIPDPTTAGDFTRRFTAGDIATLMDSINTCREKVWRKRGGDLLKEALIDVDGTIGPTLGECKQGMDISYKGIWGYHPLIVSLANAKEVLYLVNRPGNVPSHTGAAEWIDRAIDLVLPHAERVCVRGDTGFYLTEHFDRWAERVDFVFGMPACAGMIQRAESISADEWTAMVRLPHYEVATEERQRPANVKEQIVISRQYENIRLNSEHVAEFTYSPGKCKQDYRVVVLRKNLSVAQGEDVLFDDIRYFFYVTTRKDLTAVEVVRLANGRCDQENVIEQLKNGVNAMRMPVDNLLSNWAYMVMASLAWNLKAWFAMMMHFSRRRVAVLKMEFRQFLNEMILMPCQVIKQGRKIVYRTLGYSTWLKDFLGAWERIRCINFG